MKKYEIMDASANQTEEFEVMTLTNKAAALDFANNHAAELAQDRQQTFHTERQKDANRIGAVIVYEYDDTSDKREIIECIDIAALNEKSQNNRPDIPHAEQAAFDKFTQAETGNYNGFEFATLFHQKYNKAAAIYVCIANDSAQAETPFGTFNTGADGITCYFMSNKPKKTVTFNHSIYFI